MGRTEKIDARAVFEHATRFHVAGATLRMHQQEDKAEVVEAYIVISSFTSELYLKCVYALETDGARIVTHDLKKLFNSLFEESQEFLSEQWSHVINFHNSVYNFNREKEFELSNNLVEQLNASGRMFETMRYFYERPDCADQWILSPLPDILRNRIIFLKPEWADDPRLIPMTVSATDKPTYSFAAYGIPTRVDETTD